MIVSVEGSSYELKKTGDHATITWKTEILPGDHREFLFVAKNPAAGARSPGKPISIHPDNTRRVVWADTAYRSAKNETFVAQRGFRSEVHRKKPKKKLMDLRIRSANNRR